MFNDENFNGRVFVPSNIRQNKQSIIGRFDLRDVFFILVAAGIFALLFFTLNKFLGNNIALVIALIFSTPILYAGFAKFDGLKIEEYLLIMRANQMLSSKVRINNSDNIYEILEKTDQKDSKMNNRKENEKKNTKKWLFVPIKNKKNMKVRRKK